MNEIPKENGRSCSNDVNSYCIMKDTDIKWHMKNVTDNFCVKQVSTSDNFIHTQNETVKTVLRTSLPNGKFLSQNSGFDIKKLYPELSSKLGLLHSSSNEKSQKIIATRKSPKAKFKNLVCSQDSMCCETEKRGHYLCQLDLKNCKTEGADTSLSIRGDVVHSLCSNDKKHIHIKNKKNNVRAKPINLSNHKVSRLLSVERNSTNYFPNFAQHRIKSEKSHLRINCESSLSDQELVRNSVHSSYVNSRNSKVIKVFPHNTSLPLPKVVTLPSLRVNKVYQNDYYAYKNDLFPLGFETSECDTSDDDAFDPFFTSSECFCKQDKSSLTTHCQNAKLLSDFCRQQILSRKDQIKVYEFRLRRRWGLMRSQLQTVRSYLHTSSEPIDTCNEAHPVFNRKLSESRSSLLEKGYCVYSGDEEKVCTRRSLPGSRHCMRHITYNVDQQLFSQCSAKREDNTLCRTPTFDVLHDPPLCEEHGSGAFIVTAPSREILEKIKRQKKKNKMPVLSRGKRSKKRRHSFESSIVPSTRVRPPINSPSNCFGSVEPPSPLTSSNLFSTCSDENEEVELENEFKEIEEEIPLEAASHLLESKDFQDVLNKLPDTDLSQIFCASDNRQLSGTEEEQRDKQSLYGSISKLSKETEHNVSLGDSNLSEMNGNKVIDSIISFNQHELNAISQVLSNMVNDHTLNLESFGSVEDIVGKTSSISSPPLLEVSASSASYSEDSNSGSSKGHVTCDAISPTQECNSHCTPVHQTSNLSVAPPTLQTL